VRAIDSNRGLLSLDTGRSTCFDDHSPAPWITRVTALRTRDPSTHSAGSPRAN